MMQISSPQAGDVIFSRLPEVGSAKQAKPRPVVVLDVIEQNGLTYLTVAKGTSQKVHEIYHGEFVVSSEDDLRAAGLNRPTKFQLQQIERMPFTPNWFSKKTAGHIPAGLMQTFCGAAREVGLI